MIKPPLLLEIVKQENATTALKEGIDSVADIVATTLGPDGKTIIIGQGDDPPIATKDGVTVAEHINIADRKNNIGAQLIKSVSRKTVNDTGDGTTTSIILAQHLITEGQLAIKANANPNKLKSGINKAVAAVVQHLKDHSIPINGNIQTMEHVATISANNDAELGKLISEGFSKVGKDGTVRAKASNTADTSIEVVMGTRLEKGYMSPYFVTDRSKMISELNDPYILIVEDIFNNQKDITPICDKVANEGKHPLVIIADDVMHASLHFLMVNHMNSKLQCVAIKSPWAGKRKTDGYEDLAVMTGANVISPNKGKKLTNIMLTDLGRAEKVIVTDRETTIIKGEPSERIKELMMERETYLKSQIAECKDNREKEMLEDRLAKIVGGVAMIHVGATTELELREKYDRIDDSIRATRSGIEEGIVPGGGTALIQAIQAINILNLVGDELKGAEIVKSACMVPLKQILKNSGVNEKEVLPQILNKDLRIPSRTATGFTNTSKNMPATTIDQEQSPVMDDYGYNAKLGIHQNLIRAGVIDPTKVVRCALQNAASVANIVLLSGGILVDEIVFG